MTSVGHEQLALPLPPCREQHWPQATGVLPAAPTLRRASLATYHPAPRQVGLTGGAQANAHTLLQDSDHFWELKDQIANIFCFAGHMVSVITTQFAGIVEEQPQTAHKGRGGAGLQ